MPEVKIKDLSQIVLEMLASLNTLRRQQERLVEIARNGTVEDEEVEDFVGIQQELEKISITVETMQLWTEQMVAEGKIDGEIYRKYMGQKSE